MSRHSRRAFLCRSAAGGAAVALVGSQPGSQPRAAETAAAPPRTPAEPAHPPIGEGQGLFPGRVVWVHEPQVVRWDGDPAAGGWYEDRFTDAALADQMLRRTLRQLTGAAADADAWAALFRHFNLTRDRGDAGYRPGEKVVIKLNLNCSQRQPQPTDGFYNTPQLTLALLRQLIREGGIRPQDVVVYDASRLVNDTIFVPAHQEFPEIRFEDRLGGQGRFQVQPDKSVAVHFGDPQTPDSGRTYLPRCVTSATYLINAAVLKGHVLAGVTLCAKNHYGSVFRENTGPRDPHQGWNPSHLHESILVRSRPMGTYNALVDLMGHPQLGGKTILYLIDGLYAAPHQNQGLQRWQSPPFNGHWTASVFASQDPVAIESVGVDLFAAEPSSKYMEGAVDNYLHEAALAGRSPSGTPYAPAGDGAPLTSLGVHEHWNNPQQRQYSRNRGGSSGIELIVG